MLEEAYKRHTTPLAALYEPMKKGRSRDCRHMELEASESCIASDWVNEYGCRNIRPPVVVHYSNLGGIPCDVYGTGFCLSYGGTNSKRDFVLYKLYLSEEES